MSFLGCTSGITGNPGVHYGAKDTCVVRIQIDENSVTLTPFGSLIRINPARASGAKSWTAKLRALFALLFR
jgi:hypothetical protein